MDIFASTTKQRAKKKKRLEKKNYNNNDTSWSVGSKNNKLKIKKNKKKKYFKKISNNNGNKNKRKRDGNNMKYAKHIEKKMKKCNSSYHHVIQKVERDNSYPLPFVNQDNHKIPNRFINASDTHLYNKLLKDQYSGLKVDPNCFGENSNCVEDNKKNKGIINKNNSFNNHDKAEQALKILGDKNFYVYDFTQPLGLNTPIARTFVTRTCIGEPGMTYKYLGLRMFAIPWSNLKIYNSHKLYDDETIDALQTIHKLNTALNMRGQYHLKNLDTQGSSTNYNLTLINHMLPSSAEDLLDKNRKLVSKVKFFLSYPPILSSTSLTHPYISYIIPSFKLQKNETCFDHDACSVSWHADSSLENYSTIAVYQALDMEHDYQNKAWRLAVRVHIDAEGPNAGRARRNANASKDNINKGNITKTQTNTDIDGVLGQNTPPLCIPLEKSGLSYFMFNTFNHHHQHAVLAGSSERWASTHRVCTTERHSVEEVLKRNLAIVKNEKNAIKMWNNSFNGLMEIEFEWLRQWYIQGANHKTLHLVYWQDKIVELEKLWFQLQEKEMKKMKYLENAVLVMESRQEQHNLPPPPRKQRKHTQIIENMGGLLVYENCIKMLQLLIKKRNGWSKRELDPIFKRVPHNYRPTKFYDHFKGDERTIKADEMIKKLIGLKGRYEKATLT